MYSDYSTFILVMFYLSSPTGPLSKLGKGAPVAAAVGAAAASPLAALTALTAGPSVIYGQPFPALNIQFPYTDYYSNGWASPSVERVPIADENSAKSVNIGSGLGAVVGEATSAGLRTLTNVASTISNAAGTAENLQRQIIRRLQKNPVVSLVQNTLNPPAKPAPVSYK